VFAGGSGAAFTNHGGEVVDIIAATEVDDLRCSMCLFWTFGQGAMPDQSPLVPKRDFRQSHDKGWGSKAGCNLARNPAGWAKEIALGCREEKNKKTSFCWGGLYSCDPEFFVISWLSWT